MGSIRVRRGLADTRALHEHERGEAAHDRVGHRPPEDRWRDRDHAQDRCRSREQDRADAVRGGVDDRIPGVEPLRLLVLDLVEIEHRLHTLRARSVQGTTGTQASFLALPIIPRQMDYLFLSGIMYSSVPGRHARQAWLRSLSTRLKAGGVAIVSFLIDRTGKSAPPRLAYRLSSWLAGLPGANHAYQLGDVFSSGHFLHAFMTEEELRSEMTETGATIVQLNWDRQFAVLTWPR